MQSSPPSTNVDVLIIGAGISGICAAHYIREQCPNRTFAVLEGRERMGGTWDLFRYPGVRSDSDMYTLGYSFRPWPGDKAIADGPDILQYLKDTAKDEGIDKLIQFSRKVIAASWSSDKQNWTVTAVDPRTDETTVYTARFVFNCVGYYSYEEGYTPDFKGLQDYKGTFVHPQFWPEDLDYKDKNVVVIGSGATAVTLVPNLAKEAKKTIMLQRTPTYVFSQPLKDKVTLGMRHVSEKLAYRYARGKFLLGGMALYQMCRRYPDMMRKFFMGEIQRRVGKAVDVEEHFNPPYDPWDQRLCVVPHGDLFKVLKDGSAEVVTAHIDRLTENGILLRDGRELPADIIISATGLKLEFLSGMNIEIDGEKLNPVKQMAYKGLMLTDVPNSALVFGYFNASWTLKAELACRYVCRVLNYMEKNNYDVVCARNEDPSVEHRPLLEYSSGYVQRALRGLPGQGSKAPWLVHQNFLKDMMELRFKSLRGGGALTFERSRSRVA